MKKIIFLILCVFLTLTGCSKLQYVQQALLLKGLAEEKSAQKEFIDEQDLRFDHLWAVAKNDGALAQYPDKANVLEEFGQPVVVKRLIHNKRPAERWLYRYAIQSATLNKVYLFFDENDQLIDWDIYEAPNSVDSDH